MVFPSAIFGPGEARSLSVILAEEANRRTKSRSPINPFSYKGNVLF